jgi:hypothetical protein
LHASAPAAWVGVMPSVCLCECGLKRQNWLIWNALSTLIISPIMAASFSADHLVDSIPSAFLTSSDFTSPPLDFLRGLPAGAFSHVFADIRQLQKSVRDQCDL